MATVSIANTTANISGKTVVLAERDFTISGSWSFNRSPSPPFIVQAGSANVTNLDADKLDGLHGPTGAIVGTSDVQVLTNKTLTSPAIATPTITGLTTLTGGQIAFPATQSASSDPNTLDDYEEGSWTPVIGGNGGTTGQTYTIQVGRYVKIGKLVQLQAYVVLSAKGTITGSVEIQGLPFPTENTSNYFTHCHFWWSALATSWINVIGTIGPNLSAISVVGLTAAGTGVSTNLVTADIGATSQFMINLMYRTA